MERIKNSVSAAIRTTLTENARLQETLTDAISLTAYTPKGDDWTDALQQALNEHEIVHIPACGQPYYISASVVIPSNRRIEAEDGAIMRLYPDVKVLMLRNEHTADGTHNPIQTEHRANNIAIIGGHWEENRSMRLGYGRSGMYDATRSFYGVSTCILFNNIDHLTLRGMTFGTCGSFAVQLGDAKHIVIENIIFDRCMADGIHTNGNVENLYVHNLSGQVGDDLLALNMYDWQDSSVNFGPCRNVLCEDFFLSPNSECFSMRIETGIYTYADGTQVDCSLQNAWIRRIHGLHGFKMYCQTPRYEKGTAPEAAGTGSGDDLLFEDISLDLSAPMDETNGVIAADPVTGHYGMFELGLNLHRLYLNDLRITLHTDKYPLAHLLSVGPKTWRIGDLEIFDPYISSRVDKVYHKNITINGKKVDDLRPFAHEVIFDNLYADMPSTARGELGEFVSLD